MKDLWQQYLHVLHAKHILSPFERWYVIRTLKTRIRTKHQSIHTEKTYELWICRFIRFNSMNNPRNMAESEVVRFLEYLAVHRHVATNTQKLALNAVAYLYKRVCFSCSAMRCS